jgi:streptogramin lyase
VQAFARTHDAGRDAERAYLVKHGSGTCRGDTLPLPSVLRLIMHTCNLPMRLTLIALALVVVLACSSRPASATETAAAAPILVELPEATQAGDLVFEPDGTLRFDGRYGSEYEGDETGFVGQLQSGGQVQQLALPSTETAGTPVIDPAGGVWFPLSHASEDRGAPAIGHFSRAGDFQRFTLGSMRGSAYLMARSGTDLWVGEAVLNNREVTAGTFIDQVSTSPTVAVTRRIRLSPKCSPSAIAAGETEVWFAELCENRSPSHPSWRAAIVQVEPGGKLKRYRLPRLSYVTSLAIGADGTVWFGSFGTNGTEDEVGHVDQGGSLARYRVGDVNPYEIAVGPEGRLWFTEKVQGYPHAALNSIGPDGDLGQPICLAPECKLEPFGLAFAPSGELWFSALTSEVPYGGGGGGGLILAEDRANQAGFIGHLTLP